MSIKLQTNEYTLFKELIEKECGIAVQEDKIYLIESRLTKLALENGCNNFYEFYQKAIKADEIKLRNKIVDAMTTNETLWFRDKKPFDFLKTHLLPELLEELSKGKKHRIRIWSAACSTGQEPYSISMLAHEVSRRSSNKNLINGKLEILATDISKTAITLARSARYDQISMSRGLPPELKERYFEENGRVCSPKEEIKNMVKFDTFNLQRNFSALGRFDIICLRNVAIYFSSEFKQELFNKIYQALNPEGIMIIGSSESLIGLETEFKLKEKDKFIYYKKEL